MRLDNALLRCTFAVRVGDTAVETVVLVDLAEAPERVSPPQYLEDAKVDALVLTGGDEAVLKKVERIYRPHF